MITKEQNSTIMPLDLTSIVSLLEGPVGDFAPLSTEISQPSPEVTEIHVNIQQCDNDSIDITTTPNQLTIRAQAILSFHGSHTLELKRPVETVIPLAPGVDLNGIRSQLTDDHLILSIPLL